MVEIGTTFHWSYADANPLWTVIAPRGKGCWQCKIKNDCDYAGALKVFSTEEIEGALANDAFWNRHDKELADWARLNLKANQIVHVEHGFGQYVRCIVVEAGKCILKPIALVGDWYSHDLPRRNRNGEVYLPYSAKKVLEGEPYETNASHLYEYQVLRGTNKPNPKNLEAIDLSLPSMTKEESKEALLWQKIESIMEVANSATDNPSEVIKEIKKILSRKTAA